MVLRFLLLAMACAAAGCVSGRAGTRDPDGGNVRFDGGGQRDAGGRSDGGGSDSGPPGLDASLLEIDCDDGVDQDGDGDTDCEDEDCADATCDAMGNYCILATCGGCRDELTETMCGDGADEDCDGAADCADPDCDGVVCGPDGVMCAIGACPGCPSGFQERICGDGTDDDCDGLIDCADDNCLGLQCGMQGQRCLPDMTCGCSDSVEFCQGSDDDCNGVIDNGCPLGLNLCCPVAGGTFGDPLGGTAYSNPCPPGTMLIGIAGRASTRLEQIERICAALVMEPDMDARPDFAYPLRRGAQIDGTPQGGSGGTVFSDLCPGNEIVIGVHGASDENGVTGISLECGSVSIYRAGFEWRLSVTATGTTPARGAGGAALGGRCADGHVVTDLSGRAGTNVTFLQATCHRLDMLRI